MKILPKDQARAMFSIYAFCRVVDDIADEIKNKKIRERLLKKWELSIKQLFETKIAKNALERELLRSIEKFNLEKKDFISIINGMRMDSNSAIVFPTKEELDLYCDRVAVAVGYLSIKILVSQNLLKSMHFILVEPFN